MKKVLLSFILIGFTLVAFCQKTEKRNVSGFTGINAASTFDVTVTKGNTESLTIEAEDNIMPYVRSDVRDGVLYLYLDNNKEVKNVKTLKASVVMKNLDKVSLSGACKLSSKDLFTSDQFQGDCSGVSRLSLILKTDHLSLNSSGACDIDLKAEVSNDMSFNTSGTSKAQLKLNVNNVQFTSGGTSIIDMSGSANTVTLSSSGTSIIKAVDFVVKTATIASSGTSNVTMHVTSALTVNSSGASTVNYKGSPAISVQNSKASKLNKL